MEQCSYSCVMNDEHWGALVQQCELGKDHEGKHQRTLNGCTPIAVLVWEA